jgi:hypothetical protein
MRRIFWLEHLKGRDHSEDVGVVGKTILEWTLGTKGGKLWLHVIQVRNHWRGLVNAVMNFQVP